ncbi:relaxase/mobilization nuclease domain-containing protein [Hymenobacter arizonensis]|uniref:Relaxase/Mobilisation nuclease domain-containing protein n=1 Tax=Hymenobacter arizonensis TaxID=1227077 RepID=A0A1I6BQB4_HYMAR|nr:relaxase/mobilization nuclease domain-containing protein [Hymenobacter arizonensis]SFQ83115.1 Relaxase/Mobilisation nuclease domain-containing protein [Hymenobacter arizonensis]
MVSRTTIGKSFAGLVRYQFTGRRDQPVDKQAEILASAGVSTNNAAEMISDFNLGRAVNPRLGFAVWHTSLSFNPADAARLDSAKMRAIAEAYLQKMGLANTQYVVVRHHDRPDNQHLHIIANRVDNEGKTIADGRNFYRSKKALQALMQDHGLTPPQGQRPELQPLEHLYGTELVRREIREALEQALRRETQRVQLFATLQLAGITAKEYFNKAGKATGVSFEKDSCCIKGSELGRHLSLAGIDKQLAANEDRHTVSAVTAVAAVQRDKDLIAGYELEARQAERASDFIRMAELDYGVIPTAKQRMMAYEAEANATPIGRELLAKHNEQQHEIAEQARVRAQAETAVAAYIQEKSAIASYEAEARRAERTGDILRMAELDYGVIPAAKRQMAASETEAKSTQLGRELLAEQDNLPVSKVQKNESGSKDDGPAVAVPIPEKQAPSPQAVGPVTPVVTSMSLPVSQHQESTEPVVAAVTSPPAQAGADTSLMAASTELLAPRIVKPNESLPSAGGLTAAEAANQSNPVIPTAPVALPDLQAAPAVAWQYGTIRLMDSKVRTSEERMSNVRADLIKAGAKVGTIVPPTPGQPASTLMPYRFDPKTPDLEKVTKVLNDVQGAGNSTVREQVHTWNPFDKNSLVDRADWPEREGQFNQARILVQDATTGIARAEIIAADLRNAGAHVSELARMENGQVSFRVCYHTYVPAINDINFALDRCKNSLNVELQESTQDNTARYAGAVGVDMRQKELERYSGPTY